MPIIQSLFGNWKAPSLRSRVVFLAGSVVVLLSVTLLILISILRSSQTTLIARSNTRLQMVIRAMVDGYQKRSNDAISLLHAESDPLPMATPEPPSNEPSIVPPPPPFPPSSRPEEGSLQAITSRVLLEEPGLEGGFFRARDQRFAGYSFPTHEGPGNPRTLPGRELPIITKVASTAVRQRRLTEDQFTGPHDVVLFVAAPVCETADCVGGPVGSAWLMQRIPGVESDRKRAILWSAFVFALVASITVTLAFLVLQQVGQSTQAIMDRLTRMEIDLFADEQPGPVKLLEFRQVLDGLQRLADTLRNQFLRERELQSRLRQRERLAAIGQLAASVAHELRNPLGTIRLRTQMAQRKVDEGALAQAAPVILSEVDRLDGIIQRLLDFSRPVRLQFKSVDIPALCRNAVKRWGAKHPSITFRYEGLATATFTADEERLGQVLDNILENAANQLLEGGTASPQVLVSCEGETSGLIVQVRDNGGGFSAEALQSAAEPFFTTRAKGTGLGLAICNEVVELSGGTLQLSNGEDGAVVRIQINNRSQGEEQ